MNKRVGSEIAIGVLLVVAVLIGGLFWYDGRKQIAESEREDAAAENAPIAGIAKNHNIKPVADTAQNGNSACQPHYYDGKETVDAWAIGSQNADADDGILVQIAAKDAVKLPISDSQGFVGNNYSVKLIDPTTSVQKQLENASKDEPATLTIQGYADMCVQPPLVSIEPASDAFKKS